MQATIVIPYPGTPLYKYCEDNKLLLTTDWNKYDMKKPVMKSPISNEEQIELIQSLFKGIITPKFVFNKISQIRSPQDIIFLLNYAYKFLKKLKDFQ
jgi:radical SAM superfamily enzyme YgiQ (UPF0313 family)